MDNNQQISEFDWDALLASLPARREKYLVAILPDRPPERVLTSLSEGIHPWQMPMPFIRKLPTADNRQSRTPALFASPD